MKRYLMALAMVLVAPFASAEIVIGQTSAFTGPVAAGVKENFEGAKLWLDYVNSRGGVNSQQIRLVSLDDKFQPKLAAENAKKLILEHDVLALFLNRGTPHTEAIRPLLDEYKIALVAPSSGAMVLHQPVNPWIFNVRAPYQREVERTITHLTSVGVTRIGIAQVDDSFGADCAVGAQRGFVRAELKPAFVLKFDRDKPNFSAVAEQTAKLEIQAVMIIGSASAVLEGTKAIRAKGSKAQVVTVSNNASGGFIKQMGEYGRGVIVSQVFPYERSLAAPIVKEASDLAGAKGVREVTPAMLEGFAAAKVLVEGIRRAGPNPTRAKMRQALENMQKVNIGGLEVSFSPTDHTGLEYSDLSIISGEGKFKR